MRGGKRLGAGRRPRFGAYGRTTPMRIPVQLKQEVIAYIEGICRSDHQTERETQTESKQALRTEKTVRGAISEQKLNQATAILERSLQLKANAGGAIKTEIRKALSILQR
jgi:hypothetical protein